MNKFKKAVSLLAVTAFLGTSVGVYSADYEHSEPTHTSDGYAYAGTRRASSISPLLALGTVGVIAGIVVAVNNNHHHSSSSSSNGGGGGNSHSHSHSH